MQRNLAATCLVMVIATVILDGVAAAVLLPRISAQFQLEPATATWIINAYQMVTIATILPFAALAQIIGYRRVYLSGLLLFALMGMVSATSGDFVLLIAARTLQGLSAACLMSVNLAMLRTIMPPHLLGRAIGLNAMCTALATTLGPTIAGLVLSLTSWNWMFALSAMLVALLGLFGFVTLPESQRTKRKFDTLGAVLSALTFTPLIMALNGTAHGWPIGAALGLCLLSIASGLMLVGHVRNDPAPILPVDLVKNPVVALSILTAICAFATQMLIFVSLPFYLQSGLELDPLQSGMIFSIWPLALAVVAPVSGIFADRLPPGPLGLAGLLIMAAGCLGLGFLAAVGAHHLVLTMFCLGLCGIGFGLFQTPNNRAIMTSAPPARGSAASGALATARLFGQALGTSTAAIALATTATVPSSWTLATFVAAGLCVAGAVLSALRGV